MTTQLQETDFTLIFSPVLARAVKSLGIPHPAEASIFINQISFWLHSGYGHVTKDGTRWIYNSYKKWTDEQFTTLSQWQFGDMVRELAGVGIIEKTCYAHLVDNLAKAVPGWHQYRTSSWITLNIERLFELTGCQPHAHKKSPKPLPRAEVANTTTVHGNHNIEALRSQERSIQQDDSLSTQDARPDLRERELKIEQEPELDDPWSDDVKQASQCADVVEENPPQDTRDSHEGQSSAASGEGFKKVKKPAPQAKKGAREIWEIAPGRPYGVFLNWWSDRKYKPQGGRWEADSRGNAYAEFYNNREKTTVVLFPEFLEYMQQVAQNCNQQIASGIKAILPSCFVQRPEANQENVQQLMINIEELVNQGATVALPTNSVTPACTQSMSFDAAANAGTIQPLKEFIAIAPTPEPEVSADEELLRILKIKQTTWINAPALRDRIKRWVEKTDGVVIGESGPELETSTLVSKRDRSAYQSKPHKRFN